MRRVIQRYVKLTVFAFGKAETEKAFLKHIKVSYVRNTGVSVRVDCGNGDGPEAIIDLAIKRGNDLFDRYFILLDTDIPWSDAAISKAKKGNHELIPATPCIEGFLLSLLEPKIDLSVLALLSVKKCLNKST